MVYDRNSKGDAPPGVNSRLTVNLGVEQRNADPPLAADLEGARQLARLRHPVGRGQGDVEGRCRPLLALDVLGVSTLGTVARRFGGGVAHGGSRPSLVDDAWPDVRWGDHTNAKAGT
jgi:hypothetical protein